VGCVRVVWDEPADDDCCDVCRCEEVTVFPPEAVGTLSTYSFGAEVGAVGAGAAVVVVVGVVVWLVVAVLVVLVVLVVVAVCAVAAPATASTVADASAAARSRILVSLSIRTGRVTRLWSTCIGRRPGLSS